MAWIIVRQDTLEGYRGHNNRGVNSSDWTEKSMATHYRDKWRAMKEAERIVASGFDRMITVQESLFAKQRKYKTSRYTFADGTHSPAPQT